MSVEDVLMRMLGTGSSHRNREMARGVTLLLFWLLDKSPRQYIHEGSLTDVGHAQAWRWRQHAERS